MIRDIVSKKGIFEIRTGKQGKRIKMERQEEKEK